MIGAAARVLDGKQRLEVLHGLFHPDGERFNFAWEWLPVSGLSVKDFIAPSSFRFGDGRMFQMGGKFGAVSFLQIAAPELSDRMLADFMEAENGIVVNLHIQSIDHNEAIKTIKRKITDLDRMKIEEQKKAIRSGYDMDIIPSDLATYGGEAKNLLRDLQSRNERMFLLNPLLFRLPLSPLLLRLQSVCLYRSYRPAARQAAAARWISPHCCSGRKIDLPKYDTGLQGHRIPVNSAVVPCSRYSQGSAGKYITRRLPFCGSRRIHFSRLL